MSDKYILRVTAGPSYDAATQVEVPVNTPKPFKVSSDIADVELNVRIQNYQGLPSNSPKTSPYFDAEPHAYNQDQYSIAIKFTPKKPKSEGAAEEGINGGNLQFGNDFDHPIRDRLPPGFNTAMSIVKWWIDPGLDGDAYADRPRLYGPALSSFNALRIGAAEYDESKGGIWVEEGGDEAGVQMREGLGMPNDSKARMKWALNDGHKRDVTFQYGQTYSFDFFNPYLDFSNLALRLPGFHLPIMKYWDGQGLRSDKKRSHVLRYVLRNKETEEVYLVIMFSILLKEDVNEDGSLKAGATERASAQASGTLDSDSKTEGAESKDHDEETALKEARGKLGPTHEETQTSADDVD